MVREEERATGAAHVFPESLDTVSRDYQQYDLFGNPVVEFNTSYATETAYTGER